MSGANYKAIAANVDLEIELKTARAEIERLRNAWHSERALKETLSQRLLDAAKERDAHAARTTALESVVTEQATLIEALRAEIERLAARERGFLIDHAVAVDRIAALESVVTEQATLIEALRR